MIKIKYAEEWAAKPNVCRCCMSARGSLKLTKHEQRGIKGSFADALSDCFGITLSYLSKAEASHYICITCMKLLKSAYNFREQVLLADETYVKFFNKRLGISESDSDNLKLDEVEEEEDAIKYCDYEFLDVAVGSDDNSLTEDPVAKKKEVLDKASTAKPVASAFDTIRPGSTKNTTSNAKPPPKLSKRRLIRNKNQDTTIELPPKLSKRRLIRKINKDTTVEPPPKLSKRKLIRNIDQVTTVENPKKLSDRMKVILTCNVVLPYTTACPFRHYRSWFQCFYCHKEFMQMSLVRTHTNEMHQDVESELRQIVHYPRSLQIDISQLECRLCNLNLTDVASMQQHFQTAHDKVLYKESIADYKVDSSPYNCHLCSESFHVFRSLTMHLNVHYRNCICDVCGRSFINSKRLKNHKTVHVDGEFPCKECGKMFKNKPSQVNHMETAHSKRQMKCQICLKPMRNYTVRVKHMSEVHNITHIHKCKVCDKEFTVKQYLATHIRHCHAEKTVVCEECGMVFVNKHGLKKHMPKHTGVKPYPCLVCDKSYYKCSRLKEHMIVHESEMSIVESDLKSG